jgi:hypothetical protein
MLYHVRKWVSLGGQNEGAARADAHFGQNEGALGPADPTTAPEPGTAALSAAGALLVAVARTRRPLRGRIRGDVVSGGNCSDGTGRAESVRFAAAWNEAPPDLIAVSGFVRAGGTAAPLLERFPDVHNICLPVHELTFLCPARCRVTSFEERRAMVEEYWERGDPV